MTGKRAMSSMDILDTQAVRVRVAGIQGKDGPSELVHDVVARIFQDHVLRKILRQIRKIMQQPLEHVVLLLIGQVAEEQQVRDLRKAEALLADAADHDAGAVVVAQAALDVAVRPRLEIQVVMNAVIRA